MMEQQVLREALSSVVTRAWYNVWMDFSILDWMMIVSIPLTISIFFLFRRYSKNKMASLPSTAEEPQEARLDFGDFNIEPAKDTEVNPNE